MRLTEMRVDIHIHIHNSHLLIFFADGKSYYCTFFHWKPCSKVNLTFPPANPSSFLKHEEPFYNLLSLQPSLSHPITSAPCSMVCIWGSFLPSVLGCLVAKVIKSLCYREDNDAQSVVVVICIAAEGMVLPKQNFIIQL